MSDLFEPIEEDDYVFSKPGTWSAEHGVNGKILSVIPLDRGGIMVTVSHPSGRSWFVPMSELVRIVKGCKEVRGEGKNGSIHCPSW